MIKTITIKISNEFSDTVKGRYKETDGDFTGEAFRNNFLEPIFNDYDKIIIDLDDMYGCPSSFREEAFGGLARIFGKKAVLSKLEFICTDEPPLIDEILKDINEVS